MTAKRFELILYDNTIQVKEIRDNGKVIYPNEIVDLLNEITEENEQLKQQVEDLEFALRTELAHQRVEKKGDGFSDTVYDFKKKLDSW